MLSCADEIFLELTDQSHRLCGTQQIGTGLLCFHKAGGHCIYSTSV
ncbi:hypothetical protein S7335_5311 [Synechococcus sp. PCC 7335]|nr:hypothetical protein S7335_5311 [Synechococcus sp. PCC 7335]